MAFVAGVFWKKTFMRTVLAKIRSTSQLVPAQFINGELIFSDGVSAAARGQSAVLYRDDEVLGGGIIGRIIK